MVFLFTGYQHDTQKVHNSSTEKSAVDTSSAVESLQPVLPDTLSVCSRNKIADLSFYFPGDNFLVTGKLHASNMFPYVLTANNRTILKEKREILVNSLKDGEQLPQNPFAAGWIFILVILSVALLTLVRVTTKSLKADLVRFFVFREMNDPSKKKTTGLFQWQATILNITSMILTSLFLYCMAMGNGLVPTSVPGLAAWAVMFLAVALMVTLRYITCSSTGKLSGYSSQFEEYVFGVFMFYRIAAIVLFFLILLVCYTVFFPVSIALIAGVSVLALLYIIRIIRLMVIFIKGNISIFYFILYLCALEILPASIFIKFVSGLA